MNRDDELVRLVTGWARFMGEWEGTASEMIGEVGEFYAHHPGVAALPKTPTALAVALRRNNVPLHIAGVTISFGCREPGTGRKIIRLSA